ncbi:MAG: ATP synthase F1 subunit epsilon [Blastocatellia bacterium AA13]|nr:MAG: ATP synthase F1 subunit epsilon [Blastocatellia bacterium AA13]
MARGIHLRIFTPGQKVLDAEVDRVEVPALDGEIGVLPGHTELVSLLKPAGLLTYHVGETKEEIAISDGFFEVGPDSVLIMADEASRPEDIDLAKALEAKELAEQLVGKSNTDSSIDVTRALVDLERAMIAYNLANRSRH